MKGEGEGGLVKSWDSWKKYDSVRYDGLSVWDCCFVARRDLYMKEMADEDLSSRNRDTERRVADAPRLPRNIRVRLTEACASPGVGA